MTAEEKRIAVCSFTGHRTVKTGHVSALPGLVDRAIAYAYDRGARVFLAGGAVGFDTLAASRVILFKLTHPDIRLELILPCLDQTEGWSAADRERYDFVLSRADEVEVISDSYFKGCMKKRNERLAMRADMLIAYADGVKPYSGTMQTVRMANARGIEVYNLYPTLEKTK